jgi:hypothetical protein
MIHNLISTRAKTMTTECRAEGRIDCSDRVEHEDYGVGTFQDLQLIGSERCAYVTSR